MNRRAFLLTAGAAAVAGSCRRRLTPIPGPQRGITFDSFGARPSDRDFDRIRDLGVTHLALFPFGYMRSHTEPRVIRYTGSRTDWSLTDEGLLEIGRMGRRAGLRVVLIPTLADFVDGHWRGEVRMKTEDEWREWFDSYRDFSLHYARLAEQMRAAGLSVGTELRGTVHREDDWLRTIGLVRSAFHGWLTYAANWDDYQQVPWWSAVDLIGVQAYFELGDPGTGLTRIEIRERLLDAWQPIREDLRTLSARTGKRIIFTEVGYKSHVASTAYPWKWELDGVVDYDLQAAAYEAAFRTFWHEPWFAGFYWWKWQPGSADFRGSERDFTPQGKPAERVIRRWYRMGIDG